MRVLLTGGAGYIGSHVALAFLEKGYKVGIYDNLSSGRRENLHPDVYFFEEDILDRDALDSVLSQGWDGIVHLAALKAAGESMLEPEKYSLVNIGGSLQLISSAIQHGIKRFVLSSSAAVYGEPEYLPVDEAHPTNPSNYYGFTKLEIERNLEWYERLRGLSYASLRYFNAAGYDPSGRVLGLERNPANLLPVVMEVAAGWREQLSVFGDDYDTPDGSGVRDYIHVSDLADAHVAAFEHISESGSSLLVNLGSEQGISVKEILNAARTITGKEIPARIAARRAGDPAKLVASSQRARKLINWEPQYSSVDQLIETTWQVYKTYF